VDYQLLVISGVDDSTPVVPIAHMPDGIDKGGDIEVAGYGLINDPTDQLLLSGLRYHTTSKVTTLSLRATRDREREDRRIVNTRIGGW
jgi:hypothetical protein